MRLLIVGTLKGQLTTATKIAMDKGASVTHADSIEQARLSYLNTDLKQRLAKHHADPDSAFWGWNNVWLSAAFRPWHITAELATLTCPVLAIQGLDDEYGTLAQIRGIRDAVPHTQLLELPACGHSPHKDQTAAVIEAVDRFLGHIERCRVLLHLVDATEADVADFKTQERPRVEVGPDERRGVTELDGEGHDLARASVSYTLAANVEDMVLIGSEALDGAGNAGGAITMTGGAGVAHTTGTGGAGGRGGRGGGHGGRLETPVKRLTGNP